MSPKKTPLRKCIACQEMRPKKSLIRVVRTPDQNVQVDLTSKASGRGAYVCRQVSCMEAAQKKHSLNRALKTKVDPDLFDQLYDIIKE